MWAGAKAIVEDREGNLWIGSSDDGLFRYKPAQVTAYTSEDGLADDNFLVVGGDRAANYGLRIKICSSSAMDASPNLLTSESYRP